MNDKFYHYLHIPHGLWRWKNFSPKEIACKGDGSIIIDYDAMDKLQAFRTLARTPVIINSAYRSPSYNKRVGGAPRSQHLQGKAFDIQIGKTLTRAKIHRLAKQAGFTGFGDYNTFVHIDTANPRYWDLRK